MRRGQKGGIASPWDPGVRGSQADQEHLTCPVEGQNTIRKDGSHRHRAATLAAEVPRALASVVPREQTSQAHLCPDGVLQSLWFSLCHPPQRPLLYSASPLPGGGHQPSSSPWSFPPNAPHITLTKGLQGWGRKQGPCSSQPGSALHCWAHNHPNVYVSPTPPLL